MTHDRERDETVQRILHGQSAPAALGTDGRRILFRCPNCGRPWLQTGAQFELPLSVPRFAELAQELHADVDSLPGASCAICAARAGYQLDVDEYDTPDGQPFAFGFSAEFAEPAGAHFLASVTNIAQGSRLSAPPHADIITHPERMRAVLSWLSQAGTPTEYRLLTAADSAAIARSNRPGHGMPGTEQFCWRGIAYRARVPALGGACLVSLAQAMPAQELFSPRLLLLGWRSVAELLRSARVAGLDEDNEDSPGSPKQPQQ